MIAFYLVYPLLYLISLLPFQLLYAVSDVFRFILFDIIGYRRKVVLTNLRNSFPEKSEAEINEIASNFYRYFCDLVLETIKSISISYKEVAMRFKVTDQTLAAFDYYAQKNQSVIVVLGHQGNWEWAANAFGISCPHQLIAIFKPLRNKYFNDLIQRIRTRFKTKVISSVGAIETMKSLKNQGLLTATCFLGDQTPSHKSVYWTNFLNQDTPVFWGTERAAKMLDYPILYANIHRIKRGYYETRIQYLVPDPKDCSAAGDITELHTRALERDIIAQPETWLWTHRRWKRKREA